MRDPRHPRHFTDEFKRQIVELVNAGKPKADVMREYDLSKSTVDRWVKSINATVGPAVEVLVFCAIYALVYGLTTRTYSRIVGGQ